MLSDPIVQVLLSLKLGGMAEAYEEQCATPDYSDLGFDDRLTLLLDRERQHRSDRSYRTRLRQAQLREQADITEVSCAAGRGITRTTLLNLAAGDWIRAGANLSILGPTGVGKTFLACALANQACRQNRSVAYVRVPELVLSLDSSRGGVRYGRLMRRLTSVELLLLDDWGLQDFSPQARRDVLEIIEPRSARRSTVIISQLPVSAWHGVLGEGTIADAILDRIIHYGHQITLSGESWRKRNKPPALDGNQATGVLPQA